VAALLLALRFGVGISLTATWWLVGGVAFVWALSLALRGDPPISKRILEALQIPHGRDLQVQSKSLAGYHFVDLFRAANATFEDAERRDVAHHAPLALLVRGVPQHAAGAEITAPAQPFVVGPREESFFPVARFWMRPPSEGIPGVVVRIRLEQGRAVVEVASPSTELAQDTLEALVARSRRESIYRGHMLEVSAADPLREDLAQVGVVSVFTLAFSELPPVGEDDIVLDDEVRAILHRNVVDLHLKRDALRARGVPTKRGVLFYGPPGTGKTYACRYLSGLLGETTVITASGSALMRVREIFELARMLQPALVVLEDVDLVFQARETNLYASTLGDLMDELDGLRSKEEVTVVLTTNAIERLEAAIKDRPGRISQCVCFGAPAPELRRRYLVRYLRDHDAAAVDLDRLVELSDRATHAFLKEWVYRAVQVAVERADDAPLRTRDFEVAVAEMRRFAEPASGIVGFAAE